MIKSNNFNEIFSPEILSYIFSFLDAKDALLCKRVCKIWLECLRAPALWSHFAQRDFRLGGYKLKDPVTEYWKIKNITNRPIYYDMKSSPNIDTTVFYHDKATISAQENSFDVFLMENEKKITVSAQLKKIWLRNSFIITHTAQTLDVWEVGEDFMKKYSAYVPKLGSCDEDMPELDSSDDDVTDEMSDDEADNIPNPGYIPALNTDYISMFINESDDDATNEMTDDETDVNPDPGNIPMLIDSDDGADVVKDCAIDGTFLFAIHQKRILKWDMRSTNGAVKQFVIINDYFCPHALCAHQELLYVGGEVITNKENDSLFHVLNQNTLKTMNSYAVKDTWAIHSFCLMPPFLLMGGDTATFTIWNIELKEVVDSFCIDEDDDEEIKEIILVPLLKKTGEISPENYLLDNLVVGISDFYIYFFHPFSNNTDARKSENFIHRIVKQKDKALTLCDFKILSFKFFEKNNFKRKNEVSDKAEMDHVQIQKTHIDR